MADQIHRWDREDGDEKSQVISWELKQQRFDATMGYPGEGPFQCKKCPQVHQKQNRADKCQHKKWCKQCDRCFENLHDHMIQEHGGWICVKCDKKHAKKQTYMKCKCKLCDICGEYVHNIEHLLSTEHNKPTTRRTEQYRKGQQKHRQGQTPKNKA